MKKLFFVLLILIFASSASATVYRWVDERGVVNFADDYSKVPPRFQDKVEELSVPNTGSSGLSQIPSGKGTADARPGDKAKQPPPIAQNLIREGDFALKLVEALRIGQAKNEAEAESMLASAGIAPKNGWIADYPVTPDIIGELEKAVGEAADAKRLSMAKNDALKVLRTTAVEFELPIVAEIPEGSTETPPPTTPEYTEPSVVDNYYYAEGPPVVTYYPPPWDYYYMYAWVPTPFWCSGFYFPGFFILHDFHRVFHRHGHPWIITNHIRDPRTGRFYAIDPARRHTGMLSGSTVTPSVRGFNSSAARNGARSIFERSRERVGSNNPSMPTTGRALNHRDSASLGSGRGNDRQVYGREGRSTGSDRQNSSRNRPPVIDHRMGRTPGESLSRGTNNGAFPRTNSMNKQTAPNVQGPPPGVSRPFNSPSQGDGRSFSPVPRGGTNNRIFSQPNSSGFSGSHQETNRASGFGQGGGQRYGSSPGGSSGFSGSHQGGGRGSGFGGAGPRF